MYMDAKNHYYNFPLSARTIFVDKQTLMCIHPSLWDVKAKLAKGSPCRSYTWKKSWKKPMEKVYFKKTSCKYAKELSLWHRKVFNPRPRRQEWPQTRAYLDQNVDPEAIPEDMISFLSEDAQRWFRKRSPAHLGSSVVHPLLARNTTISSLYEFLRKIMLPVVVAEDHVFLPRLEPAQIDTTHPGMQQ